MVSIGVDTIDVVVVAAGENVAPVVVVVSTGVDSIDVVVVAAGDDVSPVVVAVSYTHLTLPTKRIV